MRNGSTGSRRRAAVIVQTVVASGIIFGFSALAVDVGLMYSVKSDLQSVADAASLAAAAQLGNHTEAETKGVTVFYLAREAAASIVADNRVLNEALASSDVELEWGFSRWDQTEQGFKFTVAESGAEDGANAVRVTAKRTNDSSHGAVDLIFGGTLGFATTEMTATATAILVPRDIVVVADLSGSYNDDSELKNYKDNDPEGINLYEVWQTLPKSSADSAALSAWLDANPDLTVKDAPSSFFNLAPGIFANLGSSNPGSTPMFGKTTINSSYDPTTDDGLVRLTYSQSWTSSAMGSAKYNTMRTYLSGLGYSDYEVRCIMADTSSSTTNSNIRSDDSSGVSYSSDYNTKLRYDLRAAVALGLVYWNSGISGGLGDKMGWSGGNGGYSISTSEIVNKEAYPFPSGNWFEYVAYMRDSNNSNMATDKMSGLKYQFGPKSFTNYLMEEKERNDETDAMHHAFTNPLNLTKNALAFLMDDLAALDSADRMSLVTYGTYGVVEVPLPDDSVSPLANAAAVKNTYRARQAAHFNAATNIGHGIDTAANELSDTNLSSNTRPEARKVIILLTDGMANVDQNGSSSTSGGVAYAISAAAAAHANHRIAVHAIGVGSGADMDTLNSIAMSAGTTSGYWANGTFAEIEAELTSIFQKIGGLRPVQLIE